jgi:prepilin-type N-terminal cleavage/methylation domain-containing protein
MIDKKHNGFTLVEIIVSVAALSLICALVIQLFLLAGDVNKRSEQKQQAVLAASNMIEIIKGSGSIGQLLDNEPFNAFTSIVSGNDIVFEKTIDDGSHAKISMIYSTRYSSANGDYYTVSITIYDEDTLIYSLEGGRYFAK